jgi:hypothetical protein
MMILAPSFFNNSFGPIGPHGIWRFPIFWTTHSKTNRSTSRFHFKMFSPTQLSSILFDRMLDVCWIYIISCSGLVLGAWLIACLSYQFSVLLITFSMAFMDLIWIVPSFSHRPPLQCICTHPIDLLDIHLFTLCPRQWVHKYTWCHCDVFVSIVKEASFYVTLEQLHV